MGENAMFVYSKLPQVLRQRRMQMSTLRSKLAKMGINVGSRTLKQLTGERPIGKVDAPLLFAICQTCNVKMEDVLETKAKQSIAKLTVADQKRLDELMSRNNEGLLSVGETQELEALAHKAHELTLLNAKALFAGRSGANRTRRPLPKAFTSRLRKASAGKKRLKSQVQVY